MRLLNRNEKKAVIEGFDYVRNARDEADANGWRKYFMKHEYIQMDNGLLIEYDKPSIDSDVYYNDECESPLEHDKKSGWMDYNMFMHFKDFGIGRWLQCEADLKDHGCCSGGHITEPYVVKYESQRCVEVRFMHTGMYDYDEQDLRNHGERFVLSEKERNELIEIIDVLREQYKKRLETYWKRYSDKIYAIGYWADR